MADYRSKFSGPEIDEAVAKMFQFDIDTNGCVKLKSSVNDPYDLNYLQSIGNYVVYYFSNGSEAMEGICPLRLYVGYIHGVLAQMAMILDSVQYREFINEEWTEWETWYSTGYIYVQEEPPESPQKDCLWIDISDPENPVMKIYNTETKVWTEVRPSDTMDVSIYDPNHVKTNIYEYIEELIDSFDTDEEGNKFSDLYAYHVADNTIHFKRQEKAAFMDRPTRTEVQNTMDTTVDSVEATVDQKIATNIEEITDIVEKLNTDAGTMMTHYKDTNVHTTPEEKAYWNSKADGDHTHNLDGRVRITAQNVVSGVFRVDQLPANIYEIVVKVANDAERFRLKVAPEEGDSEGQKYVQEGDTVYVEDTLTFYFVCREDQLDNESGYTKYSALLPETIEWDRVMNKPSTRDGYRLTDVPTYDEMYQIMEYNDTTTVEYITAVFARGASIPNIKGYLNLPNDMYAVQSFERIGNKILYATVADNTISIHYFDMTDIPNNMEAPYQDITGTIIYTNAVKTDYLPMETYASFCPAFNKYANITVRTTDAILGGSVSRDILESGSTFAYNEETHKMFLIDRTFENGSLISGTYKATAFKSDVYTMWFKNQLYAYTEFDEILEFRNVLGVSTNNKAICNGEIVMWGDTVSENTHTFAHECIVLIVRTGIAIYRLDYGSKFEMSKFQGDSEACFWGWSSTVFLQTKVDGNYLYALAYEARDADSQINVAWKAYTLNIVVFRFDISQSNFKSYKKFTIMQLDTIHEVGSSDTDSYRRSLDDLYYEHINRTPDSPRHVKMEISNGAFVLYNDNRPVYSILLTSWSDMYTSMIDTSDNSIKKETILGSTVYPSSSANPDCPSSICVKYNKQPYISYDGYNFYLMEDETEYKDPNNNVMVMKNIGLDQSESMLVKIDGTALGGYHAYAMIFGQTTIDNNVNEVIGDIADKIKSETGSLSSNVLYSQFDTMLNTPVNITGEENQLININIANYAEDKPTCYYRYNMTGNSVIPITKTVSGGPLSYDHYYIKGGYYQNAQYAWIIFTHDNTEIPEIGFALISSMSISVLSYVKMQCFATLTKGQINQWVNGMSFKTFKEDSNLVGYMEYNMNQLVTGITTVVNYPILSANYQSGQISISYVALTDTYATNSQPLGTLRIYRMNNRMYMTRANNALYSLSIFKENDYRMQDTYAYGTIRLSELMLNTNTIRNLPEPFLTNRTFTFAFTNKDGYLTWVTCNNDGKFATIVSSSLITDTSGTYKKQYNVWYDNNTDSVLLINVGKYSPINGFEYETTEILIYLLANANELASGGGIIYQGKIAESILKGYTLNGRTFQFPEILPIYTNYNYALLCASWYMPVENSPYGNITPIIMISRDSGPETLRRVYDLTTTYIKKLNEYQDKFEMLQDQVSNCTEYADLILELIG